MNNIINITYITIANLYLNQFTFDVMTLLNVILDAKQGIQHSSFIKFQTCNTWLFIAPVEETLTVSCRGKNNPFNIKIYGTGRISLNANCKAFTNSVVLLPKSDSIFGTIPIEYVPNFNLEDNCCDEKTKTRMNSTNLKMNINLRPYTHYTEDLNMASHKLDDLDKLIDEEDAKMSTAMKHPASILAYLISTLAVLFCAFKTIQYCRRKRCCGLGGICIKVEQNVRRGSRSPSRFHQVTYHTTRESSVSSEHIATPAPSSRQSIPNELNTQTAHSTINKDNSEETTHPFSPRRSSRLQKKY